jgi:hypothetical protein
MKWNKNAKGADRPRKFCKLQYEEIRGTGDAKEGRR